MQIPVGDWSHGPDSRSSSPTSRSSLDRLAGAGDGAAIIDELVSGQACDRVVEEVRHYMEDQAKQKLDGQNEGGSANYCELLGHHPLRRPPSSLQGLAWRDDPAGSMDAAA